jgi:uncharacterized protein (TIGR02145 family)
MKWTLFISLVLVIANNLYSQVNPNTGTFKDERDGKVYKTIKIGDQTWLAENLAYEPESGNSWTTFTEGESNTPKYGLLYDFETAKIACPTGWHLPSNDEWMTLINYLGGDKVAGNKMKANTDWEPFETDIPINSSGFSALPAGHKMFGKGTYGYFLNFGLCAYFWSVTPLSDEFYTCSLDSYINYVSLLSFNKASGFNVRCIKNL